MTIQDWLRQNDRSGRWLAKETGISRTRANRILRNVAQPFAYEIARIEEITAGAVQFRDFLLNPKEQTDGPTPQTDE